MDPKRESCHPGPPSEYFNAIFTPVLIVELVVEVHPQLPGCMEAIHQQFGDSVQHFGGELGR